MDIDDSQLLKATAKEVIDFLAADFAAKRTRIIKYIPCNVFAKYCGFSSKSYLQISTQEVLRNY